VIGKRAADLFVPELAERYESQDTHVRTTDKPLRGELELIRHVGGAPGWFLTSKFPLHDGDGAYVGLVSVSQDLRSGDADDATIQAMARLRGEIEDLLEHGEVPSVADLAALAGCSPAALDRRVRRVFGLSPRQLVLRLRVDRAAHLLTSSTVPLADVAAAAGFYDQPCEGGRRRSLRRRLDRPRTWVSATAAGRRVPSTARTPGPAPSATARREGARCQPGRPR
jgi:AraC-like DNA-binding protein